MSRINLKSWLFAATSGIALAAGAANAQTDPIPPERYTLDERGVGACAWRSRSPSRPQQDTSTRIFVNVSTRASIGSPR